MPQIFSKNNSSSGEIYGAILDCDGTLIDSIGAWQGVENHLVGLSGEGVTQEDRAILTTLTIPEIGQFFHERFGLGKDSKAVVSIIDEFMYDFYLTKSTLLPGVGQFLEECAHAGVVMCVASSSPQHYLQAGVKNTGIGEYLKEIISVNDLNTTKREPFVFEYACEKLGTPKGLTWGFEDSLYAIDTLTKAGFKTVGIFDAHEGESFEHWQRVTDISVITFEDLAVK